MSTARYIVQTAPQTYEIRECDVPAPGPYDAYARIDACAVCGTDVSVYKGTEMQAKYPLVPGHEPVGVIESIGSEASARWGVVEGDRVLIGSSLACGRCVLCRDGRGCVLAGDRLPNLGYRSPMEAPTLLGGFATHLYLAPQMLVLPAPPGVPVSTLSLFNSVGNAWHWIVEIGRLAPGDLVLILGPGPRGLAATAIAAQIGASEIVVAGLANDSYRLEVATKLGATATIAQDPEHLAAAIMETFAGRQVDLVLDATSGGADIESLLPLMKVGGRIVLGGLRNGKDSGVSSNALDRIVLREIQLLGARSTPPSSVKAASRLLARQDLPWNEIATDAIGLDEVAKTMASLSESKLSPRQVHVRVEPNKQIKEMKI